MKPVRNSRFRYASYRFPVTPSMVSSIGSMWTRSPYIISMQSCTDTTSPSLTLRFDLTILFILIFAGSHVSSVMAMQTVSFLFLPCKPNSEISQTELSRFRPHNQSVISNKIGLKKKFRFLSS